jgi:NitT/TauT family transport system substrate-binding protein
MRKILFILISLATILLMLFGWGCSKNENDAKNLQKETPNVTYKIRIGYMPIVECGPLFLGMDKQIFQKHHIQLEMKQFPGGAVILESLVGGGLDIGFSNFVSPILARESGIDLASFAGATYEEKNHELHAVMVPATSDIRVPADLKGKTIAINTRRNIDHLLLLVWLKKHGVNPNEVRFSEVPFPRMETVLIGGKVDAIATVEPFVQKSLMSGLRKIGNYFLPENNDSVEVTSYFARRDWLEKNREAALAFREALKEAINYSQANNEELRDAIAAWTKLSKDLTDKMGLPRFEGMPNLTGIEYLTPLLKEEGFIDKTDSSIELISDLPKK